jgi:hypothetical protein
MPPIQAKQVFTNHGDCLEDCLCLNKYDAVSAPAITNDITEGYRVGSCWFDVTADKAYTCLDATDGAAVWLETTVLATHPLGAGQTDVVITSVADNEVLAYDSGGNWINQTPAEAGLSAVGHTHDDRYYTETELDAGQLDNRYFTETEIGDNFYTKAELDAGQLNNKYYLETEINLWRAGTTQTEMGYLHGVSSDVQDQLNLVLTDRAYLFAYRLDALDLPTAQTWVDVPWNVAATVKVNVTHSHTSTPERISIDKAGKYLITYRFQGNNSSASGHYMARVINEGGEISGSYSVSVRLYTLGCQATFIVALAMGSWIELQAANSVAGADIIHTDLGLDPTVKCCAAISVVRIGP